MKLHSVPRVLPIQLKRFGYTFEIDRHPDHTSSSSSAAVAAVAATAAEVVETVTDLYRRSPFSSQSYPPQPSVIDGDDTFGQGYGRRRVGVDVVVGVDSDSMDVTDGDTVTGTSTGNSTGITFIENNIETSVANNNNSNSSSSSSSSRDQGVVTMKPYKLSHLVEYPKVI